MWRIESIELLSAHPFLNMASLYDFLSKTTMKSFTRLTIFYYPGTNNIMIPLKPFSSGLLLFYSRRYEGWILWQFPTHLQIFYINCVRVSFKRYMFCFAQPLFLLGAVIFKTVLKVTAKHSSADTVSFSLVSCFTIWSLNTTESSLNFDIIK